MSDDLDDLRYVLSQFRAMGARKVDLQREKKRLLTDCAYRHEWTTFLVTRRTESSKMSAKRTKR